MIKIAIIGGVGSGKSFTAKQFLAPVFDADSEVKKIYNKDRKCFLKLNKVLPNYIHSFPVRKTQLTKAIIKNKNNLNKIIKIVHPIVRLRMNKFFFRNKNKKIIILDIPLLLENKLNKKDYVLVFVEAKKKNIIKNLKKRKNYNLKILRILEKIQLPLPYKKKISNFVIKNNFNKKSLKKNVKLLKKKLLKNERNCS